MLCISIHTRHISNLATTHSPSRLALILGLAAMLLTGTAFGGIDYQQKADELMPVDCLLPGQVRKLGGQMTYVTQRRPIKTSGVDCEIRGGEYVLYDRADYKTALAIWQPLANSGDPRSQNFVGEIYEKGLGVAPDFALAASWYEKAAEQNYRPAQVNLGQLYERGLGVEYDMALALSWYRKSSNIKGKILKFVSFDYSDEEVVAMRETLEKNKAEKNRLNNRLETLVAKLDQTNSEKQAVERRYQQTQRELIAEREAIDKRRQLLATQQTEIDEIKVQLKQQLAAQKAEQFAANEAEKNHAKKEGITINFPKIVVKFDKQKLASLKKQLAKSQKKLDSLNADLEQQKSSLANNELALKERDFKLAKLAANYEKIQRKLQESRTALPDINSAAADTRLAMNTPPVIKMIEPPLLPTRGDYVVRTRSGLDQRTIIGQVSAASPLMELLVNDQEVKVDSKGIFQHRVPLTRSKNKVNIVAVDTDGLRSKLDFILQLEKESETNLYANNEKIDSSSKKKRKIPKINFGDYHALIIGNSEYESLPDLNTTLADADAIGNVLSNRYGFKITTIKDATRYDILSALNELRGKLTEDDNLLVYYAGHGELDEVNNRGHWLPVDAEADSSANWISNIAITDLLNAMSVRKVLVIADSCYSGAMTRSTLARLDAGRSEKAWVSWLKMISEKRSRISFSSGGLAPVLDGGGGKHSIFAKALLDVLESNNNVVEGKQVHALVAQAVNYAAAAAQFDQAPQYAPIRFAGHESGDFVFVPKN